MAQQYLSVIDKALRLAGQVRRDQYALATVRESLTC